MLEKRISKIWHLNPERDLLLSLFTKPAYQIFEISTSIKNAKVKEIVFHVLGICITKYGQAFAAQTTIIQDLQYWEHSAEPMAEFLQALYIHHDNRQLSDEVLRDISNKEFKDNTSKEVKDTPNSKTFASFLVKMSELCPKIVLKNMGLLIRHLDSESYTMRMALVEVIGNLIIDMATKEEHTSQKDQINGFFDLLEDIQ
jgi:condensin complex subunit 1